MPNISEVMTRNVEVVRPNDTLQRAAQLMQECDTGALPVCDGDSLVGMVTDRDITIRGTAVGLSPSDTPVSRVMSTDTLCCTEDESAEDVLTRMGDEQVRRLPVLDSEQRLVGIVSLGDLATRHGGSDTEEALREISSPGL